MTEDRDGVLWISTHNDGGLMALDRRRPKRAVVSHYQHEPENPRSLLSSEATALLADSAASGKAERLASDFDFLDDAAEKLQRLLDQLFKLSQVGVQTNPPEEVAFGELVGEDPRVGTLSPSKGANGTS